MSHLGRWRTLGHLAGVLLLGLFLSCVGGGSRHDSQGSLEVVNNGTVAMTQLFVTPSASSTWGVDQLAPGVLLPGESLTLTRLFPGFYDVQAHFSDHTLDEVFDVQVGDGLITVLDMANSGTGTVSVFNNSTLAVTEVYLTLATSSTWGPNQAAGTPIAPGASLDLTGVAPGTYDLKVVFAGGTVATPPSFAVSANAVTTVPVPF